MVQFFSIYGVEISPYGGTYIFRTKAARSFFKQPLDE
jgi:hypothetical protein